MKNKLIFSVLVLFLGFFYLIFYQGLNNSNIYEPKIENKKTIPFFQAKDFFLNSQIDSNKVFEKNYYYIVNIWASWCLPCRDEHPLLLELSRNKSIKLIGLNYKDNLQNAKNFIKKFGNPYSQILIDKDGTLGIAFGAYGVPETFLIDKNKMIIKKYIGPINQEILKEIKLIIQ